MARRTVRRPAVIRKPAPKGFNATALQVRRAYNAHFGHDLPGNSTYAACAQQIVDALGMEAAEAFILGQSNDPTAD